MNDTNQIPGLDSVQQPGGSLFSSLDRRRSVSSRDVADSTGLSLRVVQVYARTGIIPGAFQPRGKRGGWRFKRVELEAWWRNQ